MQTDFQLEWYSRVKERNLPEALRLDVSNDWRFQEATSIVRQSRDTFFHSGLSLRRSPQQSEVASAIGTDSSVVHAFSRLGPVSIGSCRIVMR